MTDYLMNHSSAASGTESVKDTATRAGEAFSTLVETMALLRAPGGCPWDAEQTHASLIRYLVEESYEVVEAVETGSEPNMPLLREELGDVLLQVVFHADIAAANPHGFDIVQVVEGLVQKLRSRHPDVFVAESENSSEAPRTAAEQQAAWDALKKKEKSDRGYSTASAGAGHGREDRLEGTQSRHYFTAGADEYGG